MQTTAQNNALRKVMLAEKKEVIDADKHKKSVLEKLIKP